MRDGIPIVFYDDKIVDGRWVKWFHFQVPDKEGKEREGRRNDLESKGHCKPCTALSGCYFLRRKLPKKKADGAGLLHPNCDCGLEPIPKAAREITAVCPIEKFTEYIFGEKYRSNGKMDLFLSLGFSFEDSEYLKAEFEKQAREKYLSGDYEFGKLNNFGQRITMAITVDSKTRKGIKFGTGWMIHPLGKIVCTTPQGANYERV